MPVKIEQTTYYNLKNAQTMLLKYTETLNISYQKGVATLHPTAGRAKNLAFSSDEQEEAEFINAAGALAEKTGMSHNEFLQIVPTLLRIMKSKSDWTK